jgi:hypothetical protein
MANHILQRGVLLVESCHRTRESPPAGSGDLKVVLHLLTALCLHHSQASKYQPRQRLCSLAPQFPVAQLSAKSPHAEQRLYAQQEE